MNSLSSGEGAVIKKGLVGQPFVNPLLNTLQQDLNSILFLWHLHLRRAL